MVVEIKKLSPELENDYEQLLLVSPVAMFNHSLLYRDFLRRVLTDAEDHYLLAYDQGELVAAIPAFVKNGPFGAVVNSLPFYGSHGGIIARPNVGAGGTEILLAAFDEMCLDANAACSTLIEAPFGANGEIYSNYQADLFDGRIGQITALPDACGEVDLEARLMNTFHYKTRNMVRKGMKSGFSVGHDGGRDSFEALFSMHDENIRGIGGMPKPWTVFEAIKQIFKYDEDYRIYTARRDGIIVSALLVFYFNGMVEYFTPATREEFRSEQPLSLLIFTAMREAIVERSAKYWNWGGTWFTQSGVYQFKSRWGTRDFPYRYHIKLYRDLSFFGQHSARSLQKAYEYFYTIPFSLILEK